MATAGPEHGSLAALAAQLADLRGKVVYIQSRLDRAGLTGDLDLPAKVAALAKEVAALLAAVPEPRHTAPYWLGLPADVHAARLAELDNWVREVLTVNYPGSVQPCWAAHPPAVWELSTLREEWLRVYDRTYPDLAGALTWHDRWLPGVAARLGPLLRDCRGGCTARIRRDRHE
jgi:hypothetical protein